MAAPRRKIKGTRGHWTASVEGRELAVIHTTYMQGRDYYAPMEGVDTEGPKYRALVRALRGEDEVVVQRDAEDGSLARRGYLAIFRFKGLEIGPEGSIRLELIERTGEPG